MTIQLTKDTYVAGVLSAAGSQHTLDAQTESYLVHIGAATWVETAYTQGRFEDAKIEYDSDGDATGIVGRANEVVGPVWATDDAGNVTGLVGPDGRTTRGYKQPRRACLLGDSIAGQCFETASSSYTTRRNGFLTWAQALLGHPWEIQYADQYAVGGTTQAIMIASQLPLLQAAQAARNYERCFISSGTNDSNSGVSLATMMSEAETLIGAIGDLGIIPVHIGILPRSTSGGMTDAKRQNLRFNDWLANYAARTGRLEFIVNAHEYLANNADANGYILAAASGDALHPNDWGGYMIGRAMYDYYVGMGLPSALQFAQSQADQYNATYNPSGVLFDNPNPLLLGGTTAPTGMSTAGTNATWAVGTRTLFNGQTKPIVQCSFSGTSSNAYLYDDNVASGAWDIEEIAEGDTIYAQAIVEITTGVVGMLPNLQLSEGNGVNNVSGTGFAVGSGTPPALPDGTILTLRTPNMVVRPYGGSGNASVFAKLNMIGENGGVVKVRAFEMRKVVD